jgi:hypothetical protein
MAQEEKPKKAPQEVWLDNLKATWENSRREHRDSSKGNIQFYARSMDMAGLMQDADVVTQDEDGMETGRERQRIVRVENEYYQGLLLDNASYVDFFGRAFIGREITPLADDGSVGVVVRLREVPDDWYGHNSGNVNDAWGRRIEEKRTAYAKSAAANPHQ